VHQTRTTARVAPVLLAFALTPAASFAQGCPNARPGRLAAVAGGATALELAALAVFHDDWWDTPRREFHVIWGKSPSKGQDALLHGAIAYHTTQLASVALRWACLSPVLGAWIGAAGAVALQLPKEIGDGFHNGFSGTDLVWVSAGAALAAARETWKPAAAVSVKIIYWPSDEYREETTGRISLPTDYAGQRYFLAVHPGTAIPNGRLPGWLGLAVGHGVQAWISEPPRHEWYLSLDLRFQALPIQGAWWKAVATALDQIHFPLPGLRLATTGVRMGLF
jgi:hypothetical protein